MLPIEVMQEKLQSALSVKRYIHTMGVSEEAVRLAEIYGTQADRQKAKVAGLLHDIGKIVYRSGDGMNHSQRLSKRTAAAFL